MSVCVGVGEDSLVDRQLVSGLIDALEHRDRMAGCLLGQRLEVERGPMEQLQRSCDPLKETRGVVLRCLVCRPGDVAHFGDRREPVVDLRRIPL
jgi:hypothetical protein